MASSNPYWTMCSGKKKKMSKLTFAALQKAVHLAVSRSLKPGDVLLVDHKRKVVVRLVG